MSRSIEAGIIKAIDAVVPKSWKHAKRHADAQERVRSAALGRLRYPPANAVSIREATFTFMEEAYLKASSNGTLPANARQIMYCARPLVIAYLQDAGCERKCWTQSSYFTQVLLPAYIEEHAGAAAWDVVFDARGHLVEPHTSRQVGLGTLDVREYIARWDEVPEAKLPKLGLRYPTRGPRDRYRAALFVEKEGFQPLFEHVDLAERFDIAIMSTKGMSVTAARQLVEALSERGLPIFVMRDFDKAGFSIVHTLSHDTGRYRFRVKPTVIDLGLCLADVQAMGLASEPVEYACKVDPRINLRACAATEEECAFLVTEQIGQQWVGHRVELNAITSEELVGWVEEKLCAHGLTSKLVPDRATLKHAYRRAARLIPIQRMLREADGPTVRVPRDLRKRVSDLLTRHPRLSWDEAVYRLVKRELA